MLDWQDLVGIVANSPRTSQDMLRAIIVFAGAGLDSAVKRVIRDALPQLVQVSSRAEEKFTSYVATVIAQPSPNRRLAEFLVHDDSPRSAFIKGYVYALTGSSMQSVEQLDSAVSALGITDSELRRGIKKLGPVFAARNQIVHELDLLHPEGMSSAGRERLMSQLNWLTRHWRLASR